ncbi:DNAJ family-like protein [Strigomonas culicis]|uniref:DNAJ family-like protein n=1 Tax=Strigomonas culicis TaxID=28005 RepID=S9W959_9TRYP|nr:DNAJ family-like protein [Strigomonas culicis]|eukprot:EPY35801.1 DNAJ family-like protein [Strigomonas culicis]
MDASAPHITKENISTFTYYQLFQLAAPTAVAEGAEADEAFAARDVPHVRKAYRRLSLRFHPDKDDSEAARVAFAVLQKALETLLDPAQRVAYTTELLGLTTAGTVRQQREERQAEEDARWAAHILEQKEHQQRAAHAARQQAAEAQERAAARMQAELTAALHTPLRQLERELVDDWDVDAELLGVRQREVERLLRKLAAQQQKETDSFRRGQRGGTGDGSGAAARTDSATESTVARMMMQFMKHERTDSQTTSGDATKKPKY